MLLGSVVGIGAAKAMMTHFCVMVRDISQLFVAGPPGRSILAICHACHHSLPT
eukprot:COSAG01_NODE_4088_length_5358_cov_2.162804_2_plen_53_part_00